MKVVKVYGALRKYLGGQCRFEFDGCSSPAQAIKALCVNFPGLEKWFLESESNGMAFRVTRSFEKITNESQEVLLLPWSDREVFSIAPVIVGAKKFFKKALKIIAGVALIAAAIIFAPAGAAILGFAGAGGGLTIAGIGLSAAVAGAVASIGVALVISGVADLIAPMPKMGNFNAGLGGGGGGGGSFTSGPEATRLESFTFSGIVNTSKQGMAVPICYGRAFVGSAVISSGLDVDQVQV
jgi:predicted phage tail protein